MIQQGTDWGFCGPAYQAPMLLQAAQNCINYYCEVAEVEGAKMPVALLGTPGLKPLLSAPPVNTAFTLVAGTIAAGIVGYQGAVGSMTPGVDGNGQTIAALYTANNALTLNISGQVLGQPYITSLVINGQTYLGSSATYLSGGGNNNWVWSGVFALASGNTYPVTLSVSRPVRGFWVLPGGSQALAVIGSTVYVISADLSMKAVGSLLTATGPVGIRDNGAIFGGAGGYAVIVDGPYGYYYVLSGQPATVRFSGSFTSGSPIISVPTIPQGLVIAPGVTLTDTGGAIGTPTTIYTGSLTAGQSTTNGSPLLASVTPATHVQIDTYVGYSDGTTLTGFNSAFGSETVNQQGSLPNVVVSAVYDAHAQNEAALVLRGFSSDPGQNGVFTTASFGSTTLASSAAASYTFNGGYCTWIWGGQWGVTSGNAVALFLQFVIPWQVGYQSGTFGSLAPSNVSGNAINSIDQDLTTGNFSVNIASGAALGQTYFSQLTINNNTYAALNATYGFSGGLNTWTWSSSPGLSNTSVYSVSMTATASLAATLTGFDVNSITLTMSANAAATVSGDTVTATIPVFGQITDAGFLGSNRVGFIEGYLIFAQPATRTFFTTGPIPYTLLFPGTWYALKDSSSDNVVSFQENNREANFIGERTSEVWYNAGNSPGVSFARVPAVGPQIGCAAVHSLSRCNQNLIWLAANEQGQNIVVIQEQYSFQRVSNHGVENAWSQYATVSDAIGYSYEEQGHWFYVLTFPTANATWVYDMTASQKLGNPCWHQRASNVTVNSDGSLNLARHRSNCYMNFQNMRIVGDYANGNIYQMSRSFYSDAGTALYAQRRAPHIWRKANRLRIFHGWLQVEFNQEAGNSAQPNPQASLRWSNDGGYTWSAPMTQPMASAAQTALRTIWKRLGRARDRVYEVTVSDPVPRDIIGCTLFFEPENE